MTEPSRPPGSRSSDIDDEIGILDVLIIFAKHKLLIVGFPLIVAVIAAAFSMTMTNIYTATTRILPPQQPQSSASAMLAQLGGIVGLGGGAGRNPSDVYVAMLKSRTVADSLVQRFGLMQLYEIDAQHPSDAQRKVDSISDVSSTREGIITIQVSDRDPKLAASLANGYVDELVKMTSVLAVTEASQRRLFFERQFALAKDNLAKAEAAARQALQTGGLVKVDDQGRAIVEVTGRLRGQISVKEVQIGAMRTFAAEQNPELQRAQQELVSLKRELAKIEGAGEANSEKNGQRVQGSESLRLLRDVKYQEVMFEMLARQYELAKIDEAKDSSVVQIIDKAVEPDRRSKPKRTLIVLLSALVALFVGIIWAFVYEAIIRTRLDPRQGARLLDLTRHFSWKQR